MPMGRNHDQTIPHRPPSARECSAHCRVRRRYQRMQWWRLVLRPPWMVLHRTDTAWGAIMSTLAWQKCVSPGGAAHFYTSVAPSGYRYTVVFNRHAGTWDAEREHAT